MPVITRPSASSLLGLAVQTYSYKTKNCSQKLCLLFIFQYLVYSELLLARGPSINKDASLILKCQASSTGTEAMASDHPIYGIHLKKGIHLIESSVLPTYHNVK